jgi:hypothetical protein
VPRKEVIVAVNPRSEGVKVAVNSRSEGVIVAVNPRSDGVIAAVILRSDGVNYYSVKVIIQVFQNQLCILVQLNMYKRSRKTTNAEENF